MKKILILTTFIISTAVCSNIFGQQEAPAGGGDSSLRDNNIKMRSVDLERTERDAKRNPQTENSTVAGAETEDQLAARFGEIKTDYEKVQLSQDAVIKAYQTGSKIDYEQIGKSAAEVNAAAKRLKLNLFRDQADKKTVSEMPKKDAEEKKTEKSVPDLIVDLDNAIGSFAMSPMFQNLRVVDPEVSKKAQSDLEKIIELSANLNTVAGKKASANGK